jgi:hypothetical protein
LLFLSTTAKKIKVKNPLPRKRANKGRFWAFCDVLVYGSALPQVQNCFFEAILSVLAVWLSLMSDCYMKKGKTALNNKERFINNIPRWRAPLTHISKHRLSTVGDGRLFRPQRYAMFRYFHCIMSFLFCQEL